VDVVLSDDDNGDHTMVTAGPPPVVDDVEVLRKTSSEMIIPDLIVTGACDSTAPPTADRAKAAQMTIPTTSGAQLHKRPHIVTKQPDRNHRASEVITHIELSHYRGPHSPLDLVPSEIVFGRISKVFGRMSQAKSDDQIVHVGDDNPPPKRNYRVLLARKILVAKYVLCFS
jgi:hypothetical protein